MRNRKLVRTTLWAFLVAAGGVGTGIGPLVGTVARAQQQVAPPAYQPAPGQPPAYQPAAYQPLDDQQIDTLTARVALYPDAILSDIFVAATYPLEVVEASQWLTAGNSAANVDPQPWDPSVKSLTRFPAVLNTMASDAAWMNDLGAAFLNQQAQVFASVQRLRSQAIAAGTLYTTPQQQVVRDGGVIEIIPADPQTIYVPTYDPVVVYTYQELPAGTYIQPPVTFVYSCPVGPWLSYDLDWNDNHVYIGDWGANRPWWHWRDHRDWHYDDFRPGHYGGRDRDRAADDRNRAGDRDHNAGPGHDQSAPAPREWSHDTNRQGPRFQPLPAGNQRHTPLAKPEALPEIDRGTAAARDAERGRAERARQGAPARETPIQRDVSPVRQAPPARETPPAPQTPPAREVPRERQTPPARENPAARETPPAREAPPVHEAPPVREAPAREAPPARETPPAHEAPPVHEAPAREAPPQQQAPPAREAPRQREAPPVRETPPAPPARQAPSGGGGAFDYGRGDDAGKSADRGGASRGGAGAGGGGGGNAGGGAHGHH